jgi:enolase-phosphatase E1
MLTNAILLDIEGTTTPIDFVHKVLFPFAKEKIGEFVEKNFGQLSQEISQLRAEHAAETGYGLTFDENSRGSVADYLRFLIDVDRKSTPLKTIQGKIWKVGYELGDLKSQIFDDVPPAFERWASAGKTIAIYSSGSVLAQRNLFKYTDHGNLTPFISNYFDTHVGGKREASSYSAIAATLDMRGEEILFVSDIPAELEAARSSKLQTALSVRPGNAEVTGDPIHPIIRSFDELTP